MKLEPASFQSKNDRSQYWFETTGKNVVQKAALFDEMEVKRRYNLSLADIINGELDFDNRTANNDIKLLFDTIASIVIDYSEEYPNREIYLTGSTATRTRLYQIKITENLDDITELFNLFN
ncbi:MAG: hypothetical protein ABIO79_05760 [Ferruginibacter sp.]